ncbi:unnamed protein product [Caretta caretta]
MSFIGQQKQKSADGNSVQPGSNFYLDEFENLTDELLFRINAFLQQASLLLPCQTPHHSPSLHTHLQRGVGMKRMKTL